MTQFQTDRPARAFKRFAEIKPGPFAARTADEVFEASYKTFLACHRGNHGGLDNLMKWCGELRRWNLGAVEGVLGGFHLG